MVRKMTDRAESRRIAVSDISARITPLASSRDSTRDAAIATVVDSFRNLSASVARFVLMFSDARGLVANPPDFSTMALSGLLELLEKRARGVHFDRMEELLQVTKTARLAEKERDALFFVPMQDDLSHLRMLAQRWARLDAMFVALCVDYVLEENLRRRAVQDANLTQRLSAHTRKASTADASKS